MRSGGGDHVQDRESDHTEAHSGGAKHGQSPATKVSVDSDDGEDGGDEEPGTAGRSEEQTDLDGVLELYREHTTEELDKKVDAGELLHQLKQD